MTVTRIAFFDVDETLINAKSMFSFRAFYFRWLWGARRGARAEAAAAASMAHHVCLGKDRRAINALFFRQFKDHQVADLLRAADAWYPHVRVASGFFIAPALQALRTHQCNGDAVAFVSGSADMLLRPLAAELGVKHVLANRWEVHAGLMTGGLIAPQTIGTGKQQAAQELMQRLGAEPRHCHAYGDHLSDLPLLQCVGNPSVIANDPLLVRHAQAQGWPVLPSAAALS